MLYSVEPRSSQWPSIVTFICGYLRRKSAVWPSAWRASVRMSALLKSKEASLTFSRNSLSQSGACSCTTGGGGAVTVTRTLESAEPPGPLAVIVYVVESAGETVVEPCALTAPTSGAMVSCVASVEVQLNVVDWPLLIDVGLAWIETVGFDGGCVTGCAGGVGATGGFFLQPATNISANDAVRMAPRYTELETRFIRILLG